MSRRFGPEKTISANAAAPVGTTVLITPTAEFILNPSKVCIAGTLAGSATADFKTGGVTFLSMAVATDGTECVDLDGYELPKSSGLSVTVVGAAITATVLYTPIDETPGVTKVASRAASYQASLGAKATRTPSVRAVGNES